MKARFTEGIAGFNIAIGIVIILIGVALAVYAFMLPDRPSSFGSPLLLKGAEALSALLLGVMLGSVFIATGELLLAFLELRRRVARIDRTLQRLAERPPEAENPMVARMRGGRTSAP